MSDFECRNGHPMAPGQEVCPICGEEAWSMDGMSRTELMREEADYDRDYYEDEDEEEED